MAWGRAAAFRPIWAAWAAWAAWAMAGPLAGCSSAGETGLVSGTVAAGDAAGAGDTVDAAAGNLDTLPGDADAQVADAAPDSAADADGADAAGSPDAEADTASDSGDAAADAAPDATLDAGPDAAPDSVEEPDLSFAQGIGSSPCHFGWSPPKTDAIQLVPWFAKAGLSQPIYLTDYPGPSNRVLVVQRPGQVYLLDNQPDTAKKQLVLDLSAKISTAGEGGLLSIALHPQFQVQRKLYVNYTSTGKFATVVSEFSMSAQNPDAADPASEKVLLTIDQPYTNHNGGQIAFDPAGYLLVGMGDGGSAGDPLGSAQDGKSLLGKMLRIDVNQGSLGKNYAIPADNPFVGSASVLPEVYALGLRNPWRFSVDPQTGAIWA
ncbi:MAG: PQQ-dependent sugar dehydrogenase, partial [Deltaproteobacteria bacterium]|nr:PQQ-dependent sugar dehydrogenase [Deltaproteobacteria bacterium]